MEHGIRFGGTIYRWHTHTHTHTAFIGKQYNRIVVENGDEERVRAWSGIEICILQWLAFVNSFSVGATKNNSWCLRDIAMTNTWEMRFKFRYRETRKPAQYTTQLDNEIENIPHSQKPKFKIVVVHNANKTDIIWCFREPNDIGILRGKRRIYYNRIHNIIYRCISENGFSILIFFLWNGQRMSLQILFGCMHSGCTLQCITEFILLRNTHQTYVRWNEH